MDDSERYFLELGDEYSPGHRLLLLGKEEKRSVPEYEHKDLCPVLWVLYHQLGALQKQIHRKAKMGHSPARSQGILIYQN